jgi:uncharacterized protein YwqG
MNKKEKMYQEIERHGANLNAIFNTKLDNITLCKKLRRIEQKGNRKATAYCNGDIETDAWEDISDNLLMKVEKILSFKVKGVPAFINSDPRGYALKIHDSWVTGYTSKGGQIYKDWGGYGILAPDFS